jgi:hypothetical protein
LNSIAHTCSELIGFIKLNLNKVLYFWGTIKPHDYDNASSSVYYKIRIKGITARKGKVALSIG